MKSFWWFEELKGGPISYRAFPLPYFFAYQGKSPIPRRLAWGAGDLQHPTMAGLWTRAWLLQLSGRMIMFGRQNWSPAQSPFRGR